MLLLICKRDTGNVLAGNQQFDNLDEQPLILGITNNHFEGGVKKEKCAYVFYMYRL